MRKARILLILVWAPFILVSTIDALILSSEGGVFVSQNFGVSPSMLPPLPSGRVLKLFTAPESGLLGGTIWPAAHALCSYLLENRQSLSNAKCIELGSGTGAVGLFAASLGANAVLTDCRPPPESAMYTTDGTSALPQDGSDNILQLLERNVLANSDNFAIQPQVLELDWTNPEHSSKQIGKFDIVLCSDVTHFSLMHQSLASTIAQLLRSDGVCLLSHQERMLNLKGQDMQLCEFIQVAKSKRLHVERLPSASTNESHDDSSRISMLSMRHT